jgi:thiamine-phosphate pyrophosphorylase
MIYRILDANGNRAREAARVLEEHARFGWEDATLSAEWKRFRHDLSAAAQLLDERAMIAARDTPGDVGTHITTDQETQRHSGGDVVRAAAKRLGEALRTLEEYGKPIHVEYAGRIETLRYAAYDLEKRMMRRLSVRQNFAHVRLYVLITEALCRRDWMSTAREAIAGGADGLQLREKNLDGSEMVRRATRLSQLCHDHGVLFIVNDRPDVAVLSHADGVHVGQDDLTVQQARRIIGADLLIGKSTHSIAQAQAAAKEGPDYIAVGPMFESTTKTQSGLAGPKTLAAVMKDTTLPIVAIGGIKATNVREILDTGCERAAVCSEVISADDVRSATRVLKEALVQGR